MYIHVHLYATCVVEVMFSLSFPPSLPPSLSLSLPPLHQMIDDSHPCYSIKYLRNKPLKELKGDEFLKLVQAEEERLVEMKISIDRDLGPEKRYNIIVGRNQLHVW